MIINYNPFIIPGNILYTFLMNKYDNKVNIES